MRKLWRERLVEARERGGFTHDDRVQARNWCTCAVSEQPHILETYQALTSQTERGDMLFALFPTIAEPGANFYLAVLSNDVDRAEHLLNQIEDEALRLKREAVA